MKIAPAESLKRRTAYAIRTPKQKRGERMVKKITLNSIHTGILQIKSILKTEDEARKKTRREIVSIWEKIRKLDERTQSLETRVTTLETKH